MEPGAPCLVVDVQVARLRERQAPEVPDLPPDNRTRVLEDQPTSKQVIITQRSCLAIFCGIYKAFNTVDHEISLIKL